MGLAAWEVASLCQLAELGLSFPGRELEYWGGKISQLQGLSRTHVHGDEPEPPPFFSERRNTQTYTSEVASTNNPSGHSRCLRASLTFGPGNSVSAWQVGVSAEGWEPTPLFCRDIRVLVWGRGVGPVRRWRSSVRWPPRPSGASRSMHRSTAPRPLLGGRKEGVSRMLPKPSAFLISKESGFPSNQGPPKT